MTCFDLVIVSFQDRYALTERSDWSTEWVRGREMWSCVRTESGVEACVILSGTTEMLKWSAISWATPVKVCIVAYTMTSWYNIHSSGNLLACIIMKEDRIGQSTHFLLGVVPSNSYMYVLVCQRSYVHVVCKPPTHCKLYNVLYCNGYYIYTDSPLYRCCGYPRFVFSRTNSSIWYKPGGLRW